MKILSIRLELTKNGLEFTTTEWLAEKKKSIYVLKHKSQDFDDVTIRHLQISEIMKPLYLSSSFNEFVFNIKCFPEQESEAKELILQNMKRSVQKAQNNFNEILKHIN